MSTEHEFDGFIDGLAEAIHRSLDDDTIGKAMDEFVYRVREKIEYEVLDENAEALRDFVTGMVSETVTAIINGDVALARRYLKLDGYTGRCDSGYGARQEHSVIHGEMFESDAIKLRRRIAQAHADLIRNERIADLEDEVESLIRQVTKRDEEVERLRNSLAGRYA